MEKLVPPKFKANDPVYVSTGSGKKWPGKVLRVDAGYYEDRAHRYTVRIVGGNEEETTNWYREEYLERGDINKLPKSLRDFQAIAPIGKKPDVVKQTTEDPLPTVPTVEQLIEAGYDEEKAKKFHAELVSANEKLAKAQEAREKKAAAS